MSVRFYLSIICLFQIIVFHSIAQEPESKFKTGQYTVETTSREILGPELAASFESVIKQNETIKWTIFVPENYDPAFPPGMIVHMTQRNLAKMPIGWASVLKDKNMIWISLNKVGTLKRNKEMMLSVLATPYIQERYKINNNRIYLVASADSCYAASAAMQVYPDIFKGAIYSTCEALNWKKDIPDTIDKMKKNRYVFVSSKEKDIGQIVRRSVRKYEDAGITKIKYLKLQELVYGRNFSRRRLNQTIELLDDLN
ncbi:MAG: hypothetical protein JKY84_01140 [Emcibacteraceae bacterium]|nr:hypothetical protein [Emcibacteraceae bacterium]